MRVLTQDEMTEVIDHLQGTCLSLNEGIYQALGDQGIEGVGDIVNEIELYAAIDNAIFLCSRCGWWCEAGDWIDDRHPNYDPCEEICFQCGEE